MGTASERLGKKKLVKSALIILIVIGLGIVGVVIMKIKQVGTTSNLNTAAKVTTQDTSNTDDSSDQIATKLASAQLYQVADEIQFATQKLKINSVRSAKIISSEYSTPKGAAANSKFVIVNLTVTNTTDLPFMYAPFIMFDDQGRLYQGYENTIGSIDDYMDVRKLAPSVPETGNAVYEVPETSKEFRLGGLNLSTQKLNLIKFSL